MPVDDQPDEKGLPEDVIGVPAKPKRPLTAFNLFSKLERNCKTRYFELLTAHNCCGT